MSVTARTLVRRATYGGRKGRRALRRFLAMPLDQVAETVGLQARFGHTVYTLVRTPGDGPVQCIPLDELERRRRR